MFTSIVRRLKQLNRDETPPSAVEQLVLFGLIVVACLICIRLIATGTSKSFQSTANVLKEKPDDDQDSRVPW